MEVQGKRWSRWTEAEDGVLREHYPSEGSGVAVRLSGRSIASCSHRATRYLGIRSLRKSREHKWTEADDEALQRSYPHEGASQRLADLIGVSRVAVGARARRVLGLSWSPMSKEVHLKRRRAKARERYSDPEYRAKRQEGDRLRRYEHSSAGLCHCGRERFHQSTQCKLHWAVTIGTTAGNATRKFATRILELLEEQHCKCALTGKVLVPGSNTSLDHIVPKAKGGGNDSENLQWVTPQANKAKGTMSVREFLTFCQQVIEHNRGY